MDRKDPTQNYLHEVIAFLLNQWNSLETWDEVAIGWEEGWIQLHWLHLYTCHGVAPLKKYTQLRYNQTVTQMQNRQGSKKCSSADQKNNENKTDFVNIWKRYKYKHKYKY